MLFGGKLAVLLMPASRETFTRMECAMGKDIVRTESRCVGALGTNLQLGARTSRLSF